MNTTPFLPNHMSIISTKDRTALDTLNQLIHDPQTTHEMRTELREEWFGIATGYVLADLLESGESKLTLIRHGESEANAGLPSDSPAGIPLTPKGHEQATALAARFSGAPDLIVVSPFLRTQQTAAPLMARFPDVPVEEWPVHEFTYLNPELYRGTTESQRGQFAHEYWQRCDPHWQDGGDAESFACLVARIDDLEHRFGASRTKHVVIFTHGYFIKALLLRREHAASPVDAEFMAAFRDGRKNDPLPNGAIIELPATNRTTLQYPEP